MASAWVSGIGTGSGDISVMKTSSCSIMSSTGGEADLGGEVRDISGITIKGLGGMSRDSVPASSSASLQLAVGVGSLSFSGVPAFAAGGVTHSTQGGCSCR